MKPPKIPKLPVRARTLSNKVRAQDPWKNGKELADLIDRHWDSIKEHWPLAEEGNPWFKEFCQRHRLAPRHVFQYLCTLLR